MKFFIMFEFIFYWYWLSKKISQFKAVNYYHAAHSQFSGPYT